MRKSAAFSGHSTLTWKVYFSILWKTILLFGFNRCSAINGEVRDYCESETFKARCSYDEVITMTKAVYGRMRLDRCVKVNMGYIGCQKEVLDIADDKCSGRRSCEIRIPDPALEDTQPCLELKSYLETSYDCLKVLTVDSNECRKSKFLRAHQTSGRIASVTAQETYCGTVDTPWLIQGSPGQRINVTLVDFNAQRRPEPEPPAAAAASAAAESCHKYATVLERGGTVDRSVVVCGRRSRVQSVYLSEGHVVQVQIETRRTSQDYFLLNYEVIGCPDPIVSNTFWSKRVNNEATVGCRHTSEKWTLTCDGNKWSGETGNCTYYANIELIGQSVSPDGKQSNGILTAVLCIMVFLISMIAVLLSVLMYRRYRRRQRRPSSEHPATSSSTKSKSREATSYEDDEGELASYVRPYKSRRYGKHQHQHQHSSSSSSHQHQQQQQQQHRPRSDSGGSKATDYSANYEKVGSCKLVDKYTHIWEMPLPTPGE